MRYAVAVPRRLRTIPIYLLLGTLLNVAVAWGIVMKHGYVHTDEVSYYNPRFDERPVLWVTRRFGLEIVQAPPFKVDDAPETIPPYPDRPWWPHMTLVGGQFEMPTAVAAGWPCASLCTWYNDCPPLDTQATFRWGLFWRPPWLAVPGRYFSVPVVLPGRPLWTGLLGNTAFYAALLWCLFAAPRAARSTLRRRRGLCPRCGYPREDHAVCPECGTSHNPEMTEPPAHAAPPA